MPTQPQFSARSALTLYQSAWQHHHANIFKRSAINRDDRNVTINRDDRNVTINRDDRNVTINRDDRNVSDARGRGGPGKREVRQRTPTPQPCARQRWLPTVNTRDGRECRKRVAFERKLHNSIETNQQHRNKPQHVSLWGLDMKGAERHEQ
jgi:hypothetical protein